MNGNQAEMKSLFELHAGTFVQIMKRFENPPLNVDWCGHLQVDRGAMNTCSKLCGCMWFAFYVIQLLPIIFTQRNLWCICKSMVKIKKKPD